MNSIMLLILCKLASSKFYEVCMKKTTCISYVHEIAETSADQHFFLFLVCVSEGQPFIEFGGR
jgi:hypothetical protein